MLPETMTNKGLVKVKLNLEADGRWYLSSPVKNTKLERFYPDNDPDNDFVYVFRNETGRWRWHRVDGSYIQNNEFLKKMENISANYKKEKTIEYTGEVYNQDVENDYPGTGYYLVGNPFPTAIDWNNAEGWNREGFSNTMWSWITIGEERVIMTYKTNDDGLPSVGALMPKGYDADNMSHIPPYQSFWVKKESADNSKLVVKREARIKKSSAPLKSSSAKTNSDNFDLLRVHADNAFTRDGAVLYFHEQFTEGEGKEDSRKRFNNSKNVPELFTRVDNQALSINGLPSLNEDSYHMPLSVRNRVEGEVKLSFDLNKFSDAYDVYLEDKKNGNWMNVRVINEYAYLPAKQGEDDRFVIHIQKAKEVSTTIDNSQWDNNNTSDINIDGFAQYVQVGISNALIQAAGNATIDVLDINGRLIQRQETNNTENEITLHGENGVYMVRVNVGGIVKTEKVIKAE
jgi:hypothetical protein